MNLQEKLNNLEIKAQILEFEKPVRTVEESAAALNVRKEVIVKSILLILGEEKPLICILRGSDSINVNKLREIYDTRNIRTAKPEEVLEYTGYEVGALPPVGNSVEAIVDEKVLEYDEVYAGGGSKNALLKISPKDILKSAGSESFSYQKP